MFFIRYFVSWVIISRFIYFFCDECLVGLPAPVIAEKVRPYTRIYSPRINVKNVKSDANLGPFEGQNTHFLTPFLGQKLNN